MRAAGRPHAAAGAALLAAGAIAVAPVAPWSAEITVASPAMRLIADDSLLNVPLNLFHDLVNIPYNEIQAVDFAAKSLFFSGPWFIASPTNLWGVDPGDPSHYQSVVNFLLPFPALSGMDSPETDFTAGVGQQLWGLDAVLLPVSAGCDAASCLPLIPTSPITGITGIDALLWPALMGTMQQEIPLYDGWLRQALTANPFDYTFGPDHPDYTDPSGAAYSLPAYGDYFMGTTDADGNPDTPGTADTSPHLMPWAGDTYHLSPLAPLANFFQSLTAPPATDGFLGTGMHINPLDLFPDLARAMQAVIAADIVAFDPFTPGSPYCLGNCSIITDLHLNYPDIVKFIGNIWPGNPIIDDWETALADGTANGPTQELIDHTITFLNIKFWDFGNPSPPPDQSPLFDPSTLAPFFHQLWTSLGLNPPPLSAADAAADGVPGLAALTDPTDVGATLTALLNPANW